MRRAYILKQVYEKLSLILHPPPRSNKYFKHLLSRSAQVHCLASVSFSGYSVIETSFLYKTVFVCWTSLFYRRSVVTLE